jgi:putative membrane protein
MRQPAAVAWGLLLSFPAVGSAHDRRAAPDTWPQAWDWDPLILLTLGTAAWIYCRGLTRLWAQVGVGTKVSRLQRGTYLGSLLVVFVALLSPLDALAEELSSFHMIQHMLLIAVAAPLFVFGSPGLVLAWGLPEIWHGKGGALGRFVFRIPNSAILRQPLLVWGLFAATLWIWHHPVIYQSALRDPLVHDAQHLSFFIVACLFWRKCLDPLSNRRLSLIVAIPYLFATSVQASALGVFLALSPVVWYEEYVTRTGLWGLTPLEDQQLAGLIMWMPACLAYPLVAAILFGSRLTGLTKASENGRGAIGVTTVVAGR